MNNLPQDFDVLFDSWITKLRDVVQKDGSPREISYLGHSARYRRTVRRICELAKPGSSILDIGSHYLHLAYLLQGFGYNVTGIDVPDFANSDILKKRADVLGIKNAVCDSIDRGQFLDGLDSSFDVVLFLEILEHITFNPVCFWRRVYELLKPGGSIYLTTPNGTRPWAVMSTIKEALLLRGIGTSVDEIISTVTYGHHWKEYSGREIQKLFALLSPDFAVEVRYYNI